MTDHETKCVILADEALPLGVLANTTAILGITLGKLIPNLVGADVRDASGQVHRGITTIPVPILRGNKEILRTLREKLYTSNFSDIVVADFSDVAQCCNTYDEYIDQASSTKEAAYTYLGLILYGNKKKINKLTGSMPLLR